MSQSEKPQGGKLAWFLAGFFAVALAAVVWADARVIDRLVARSITIEERLSSVEVESAAATAGALLLIERLAIVEKQFAQAAIALQGQVRGLETAANMSLDRLAALEADAKRRPRVKRTEPDPPASSYIRLQ